MVVRIVKTGVALLLVLPALLGAATTWLKRKRSHQAAPKQGSTQPPSVDMDTIRDGYESAIQLWIFSGQMIWQRLSALLVANSILAGTVGLLIADRPEAETTIRTLCALGITVCLIWLVILERSFAYQNYYIDSTIELEEQYLHPVVTASRGRHLERGVTVVVGHQPVTHRLDGIHQRLGTRAASWLLVLIFAILYGLGFGQTIKVDMGANSSMDSTPRSTLVSVPTPTISAMPAQQVYYVLMPGRPKEDAKKPDSRKSPSSVS